MPTETPTNSKYYQFFTDVAQAAGRELRQRFRQTLTISSKSDRSIVTDADLASERVILAALKKSWPEDLILSEEAGSPAGIAKPGQYVWIVDPLDGTTNFAHGYAFFSISIARCFVEPSGVIKPIVGAVFDVCNDVLYFSERGQGAFANKTRLKVSAPKDLFSSLLVTGFYYQQGPELEREVARYLRVAQECQSIRRDGSAALDLALCASGVFDAFWEKGLKPWDVAAGILLVEESGGITCNYPEMRKHKTYDMTAIGLIAGEPSTVHAIEGLLL
jgi:myo-inositol-1(or 4)-monophosphatase